MRYAISLTILYIGRFVNIVEGWFINNKFMIRTGLWKMGIYIGKVDQWLLNFHKKVSLKNYYK